MKEVVPSCIKSPFIIQVSRKVGSCRTQLGVGRWGAVPAMVRRSDEAVCVCVCVCVHWRAVGGLAPALGPGVFWGTAVQLMAGIWALTCVPHPALLFMTNCFVL